MVYVMRAGYLGQPVGHKQPIPIPVRFMVTLMPGSFFWVCQHTLGKADLYWEVKETGNRYGLHQMPAADLLGLLVQSGTPEWSS